MISPDHPQLLGSSDVPDNSPTRVKRRAPANTQFAPRDPDDPETWNAGNLGWYFGRECTARAVRQEIVGFAGFGNEAIVATEVKKWMAAGMQPEEVKEAMDYFFDHLPNFCQPGWKPAKAFVRSAAIIRSTIIEQQQIDSQEAPMSNTRRVRPGDSAKIRHQEIEYRPDVLMVPVPLARAMREQGVSPDAVLMFGLLFGRHTNRLEEPTLPEIAQLLGMTGEQVALLETELISGGFIGRTEHGERR